MDILSTISLALAALAAPACAYLALLALLARKQAPLAASSEPRFALVVPAHDEERDIATTVRDLLRIDYPEARRRVVVVADNCTDATAARAREAGAEVLERHDAERRGKGFALEHAFSRLLEEGWADALVVIDADTTVSQNLLRAFAARLERGEHAVQAEYGVRNAEASWRTRLMVIALALMHGVRSSARERLGLSTGLRGNGMCFSRELLLRFPHRAYGLVEDVEYGVELGLAGVRVAFAGEAFVGGEMAATSTAAASQRRRWEGGRLLLVRQRAGALLGTALRKRSAVAFDLLADLLVPPLGYLGLAIAALLFFEVTHSLVVAAPTAGLFVSSALACLLALYVGRGLVWSGLGWRGLVALAWAPLYVLWKLTRVRPWRPDRAWIRTQRMSERAG